MRNLKLLTTLLALVSTTAFASVKPITCETNFGTRSFTVQDNSVAFHNVDEGRSISSIEESRTLTTHKGFRKIIYKDGNKHLISIKDLNNLNSNDDFLAISNSKGHKVTFPIQCSLI